MGTWMVRTATARYGKRPSTVLQDALCVWNQWPLCYPMSLMVRRGADRRSGRGLSHYNRSALWGFCFLSLPCEGLIGEEFWVPQWEWTLQPEDMTGAPLNLELWLLTRYLGRVCVCTLYVQMPLSKITRPFWQKYVMCKHWAHQPWVHMGFVLGLATCIT